MKEWNVVNRKLKDGGMLIIKHNNYFKSMNELILIKEFFEIVNVYKPELSCEGNSEVYFICKHFKEKQVLIDNERNKFVCGINNYFANLDECWTEKELMNYLGLFVEDNKNDTNALNLLIAGGFGCVKHVHCEEGCEMCCLLNDDELVGLDMKEMIKRKVFKDKIKKIYEYVLDNIEKVRVSSAYLKVERYLENVGRSLFDGERRMDNRMNEAKQFVNMSGVNFNCADNKIEVVDKRKKKFENLISVTKDLDMDVDFLKPYEERNDRVDQYWL